MKWETQNLCPPNPEGFPMPISPQKDSLAWEGSILHLSYESHRLECMGQKEPHMQDMKKRYDFAACARKDIQLEKQESGFLLLYEPYTG